MDRPPDHVIDRLSPAHLDPALIDALGSLPDDMDPARGVGAFTPSHRELPPAADSGSVGVRVLDVSLPRMDDPDLPLRLYRPAGDPGRRVLVLHGGGFITDSPASSDAVLRRWAAETGHLFAAPTLRLAPADPFPAALDDAFAALAFIADDVAVEDGASAAARTPLSVMGVSSGGALAAGLALKARDHGWPQITALVLAYPTVDDRMLTRSSTGVYDPRVWNTPMTRLVWQTYLAGRQGEAEVSPLAAPARAQDLSGLPHTTITVNEHDPLRDEGVEFAQRLWAAGVPTDLHWMPGTFHGSMALAPEARVSRRELLALRRGLDRG